MFLIIQLRSEKIVTQHFYDVKQTESVTTKKFDETLGRLTERAERLLEMEIYSVYAQYIWTIVL